MHTAPLAVETATANTTPPPAATPMSHRAIRALLFLVGLCQTVGTLYTFQLYFDDLPALAGQNLEQSITTAVIALSPVAAIAALVFALIGRLRVSIIAVAVLSLLDWSRSLPKIVRNGFELYPAPTDQLQFYVLPALCLAALILASRNTRPVAAGLMAVTPSVLGGLFWIAFSIVVSIYGF